MFAFNLISYLKKDDDERQATEYDTTKYSKY